MTQNTVFGRPYSEVEDPLTAYEDRKRAEAIYADTRAVQIFSSAAIRNSTYAAFTSQGGVMVNGMMCTVAGRPMYWLGGGWRGIVPEAPVFVAATRQLPLARNDGVEDSFVEATVPDPGYPYRVWGEVHARTYANCQLSVRLRGGNGALDPALPDIGDVHNHYVNNGLDVGTPRRATQALTGPSRLIGYALRVGGTGDWSVTSGSLYYQVEPV